MKRSIPFLVKLAALAVMLIVVRFAIRNWAGIMADLKGAQPLLKIEGATVVTQEGRYPLYGLKACNKNWPGGNFRLYALSHHRPILIALNQMPDKTYKGTLFYYYVHDNMLSFWPDTGWESLDVGRLLVEEAFAVPNPGTLRSGDEYASILKKAIPKPDKLKDCDPSDVETLKES